jgi:phospholipid/cholesterol/gamma-HCH transport system ATP-binding protein
MIEIIDLRKSFGDQQVLRGVSLTISDGEVVAIIGESGGGKSVLLKHLLGLLKPDSGKIVVDGVDITTLSREEFDKIRSRFGVVFQGSALFDSMTIFENIVFPLREKTKLAGEEIRARGMQALKDVGLSNIEDKYPAEISGGMKRRVALARALITEPAIVFFDEPTTGLDPIILHTVHRLIRATHRKYGFTGIIISHEIPEIFEVADKVAMLYRGVIAAVGTPEEIKNSSSPVVLRFINGGVEENA